MARLRRLLPNAPEWTAGKTARYSDVAAGDADRVAIESMIAWGRFGKQEEAFQPEASVNWGTLHRWATAMGWKATPALAQRKAEPLLRGECARLLWQMLRDEGGPVDAALLHFGGQEDADGDGRPDNDDPLPRDRDNDSTPDTMDAS
jgi:hypothetical protein